MLGAPLGLSPQDSPIVDLSQPWCADSWYRTPHGICISHQCPVTPVMKRIAGNLGIMVFCTGICCISSAKIARILPLPMQPILPLKQFRLQNAKDAPRATNLITFPESLTLTPDGHTKVCPDGIPSGRHFYSLPTDSLSALYI